MDQGREGEGGRGLGAVVVATLLLLWEAPVLGLVLGGNDDWFIRCGLCLKMLWGEENNRKCAGLGIWSGAGKAIWFRFATGVPMEVRHMVDFLSWQDEIGFWSGGLPMAVDASREGSRGA